MKTPRTSSADDRSGEAGRRRTPATPATPGAVALHWWLGGLPAAPLAILPHEARPLPRASRVRRPGSHAALRGRHAGICESSGRRSSAPTSTAPTPWSRSGPLPCPTPMGPMVTYAIVAGCCYACARWQPFPAFVAVAVLSQLRIRGRRRSCRAGSDRHRQASQLRRAAGRRIDRHPGRGARGIRAVDAAGLRHMAVTVPATRTAPGGGSAR